MEACEHRFHMSPLKYFVSDQLTKWRTAYVKGLTDDDKTRRTENPELIQMYMDKGVDAYMTPASFWRHAVNFVNEISSWLRWNSWHTNHFLWIQDVLEAKQVVHTTWGKGERWKDLGANDANNTYHLPGRAPRFHFAEKSGMRWDVVISLLEDIGVEDLRMAEVGVFAGHFSKFLLERFPKMQLLGIDPYIGSDETFPGDYSKTLDPAVAYSNALETFETVGGPSGRATLLPTTSAEAVKGIPDQSLHAVFIDGCHFYDCVREDLDAWLPKVMPGGLVMGHDFSPQWPGVVRAVWETRQGKPVHVGMDWMYWWQVEG